MIPDGYFAFFDQLAKNNDRQWFKAHQMTFEQEVEGPFLALLDALRLPLAKVCPEIRCEPGRGGGTVMRIHRDTRFSKDKSPYKTHMSAMMLHRDQNRGPGMLGFFLQLGAGENLLGAGLSAPNSATLGRIRNGIVELGPRWSKLNQGLEGPSRKRMPPGFDAQHVHADDLKRLAFYKSVYFTRAEVIADEFPKRLLAAAKSLEPLLAFLAQSARLPW
jgi:uncharacterized protein (TIGR02453 family)